jgi:hypothetical protein
MSAELLRVHAYCRACDSRLSIDEMHYYASTDGSAACEACEATWLAELETWRDGGSEVMPKKPNQGALK